MVRSTCTPKRADWLLKKFVIDTLIANDGSVYGGAARDTYRHVVHEMAFTDQVDHMIDQAGLFDVVRCKKNLYQDPDYLPSLKGRLVIPTNIDACVHISDHKKLMDALAQKFPSITKVFEKDICAELPDMQQGIINHIRYKLKCVGNNVVDNFFNSLKSMIPSEILKDNGDFVSQLNTDIKAIIKQCQNPTILDLMVYTRDMKDMPDPPFRKVDFMCNALILDKYGYRLSRQVHCADPIVRLTMLIKILEDIKKQKAVLVNLEWYRLRKLMMRGWSVEGLFKNVEMIEETSYEGHCLICHESLEVFAHMKLPCCDARYHPLCLRHAFNHVAARQVCVMCSQPILHFATDSKTLTEFLENNLDTV